MKTSLFGAGSRAFLALTMLVGTGACDAVEADDEFTLEDETPDFRVSHDNGFMMNGFMMK